MARICWLTPKTFSDRGRFAVEQVLRTVGVNPANVSFMNMHRRVQSLWIRKGKSWAANPEKHGEFKSTLKGILDISDSTIIVCQDKAALEILTGYKSLDQTRGSVYWFDDKPVIVVDELAGKHTKIHGNWTMVMDYMKIKRWFEGNKRTQPKFVYQIVHTLDDIRAAEEFLLDCVVISQDIENAHGFITCDGFSGLHKDGRIRTFVFPFYNPLKPGNAHFDDAETEIRAWRAIQTINDSDVPKVFQNGSYDCAYLMTYHITPKNYFLDTLHLWHSIWSEAPKSLNFISSILLDNYRYWKDEIKGDKKTRDKNERVPGNESGYYRYLRYNGLDCYNTLLDTIYLVPFIVGEDLDWAKQNYNIEFSNQVGPAFFMSMTGVRRDKERQRYYNMQWLQEHKKNLAELRVMCDDQEFNPNSSQQFASLLYDVLGATPIKTRGSKKANERSVDERVLKLIKPQHPLFAAYIDKVWDTKKPLNNCSKYGEMYCPNDRFMYQYNAAGTKFGRYAGKAHQFWVGTNPQNIPDKVRPMLVADDGYYLVDIDYSQSDGYFVAHECEDTAMIRNITDDRDTHCVHAAHFFQIPYEKVLQGHKEKAEWTEHPIRGVRQNAKRITHGANYRMAGFTLYQTMGREAVIGAAQALGHTDAHLWGERQLVDFCAKQIKSYYILYPTLPEWFNNSAAECKQNGNKATCAFGLTHLFFGNPLEDHKTQRELSSFFGQGGTAGNINRSLIHIYYQSDLITKYDAFPVLQTHDSISFLVPYQHLHVCVPKIIEIMEQPVTIKGRTFIVPAEAEVGLSWGKRSMISYHPDLTHEEILAQEQKVMEQFIYVSEAA